MSNYGTNVSFSVPVYQRPAIRTQDKPEINVETIDVSKFVKGFAEGIEKRQEAEQEQQMEALRTAYANERDQIQIALEQGEINETNADIMSRNLSASYRARGLTVEDDMKIKKGYGEALAGLAKTRQEMIVKEQEQVRQDRRKEIRDMFPSLKDADNNTIDSLDNYSKMFGQTQDQLHAVIDNPYTSQAEREGAMMQLTNSIENEAYLNTQAIALNYMEQVETTGQVNTDFKQKFLEDTAQQLVSKGFPPAMARLTSENLWKTTGLADYHNLSTIDRESATKEFQSRTANYEAALKTSGMEQIYAKIKERPQMAAILALPEQSQRVLPQYMWEDFNNNFVTYKGEVVGDQVEQKKLEFTGPDSLVGAIQYHNIVLKSQTTSNTNKNYTTGTVAAGANSFLDKTDIKTASKQDLATASKNATELRTRLDTPAVRKEIEEGLRSKNPETVAAARQTQKEIETLSDKETAIKFMYNVEGPVKELLADNANRMRTDSQGNVVLTGNRSWWQAVTDQFTDLEHTVESINNGASMLSPDERKRMFQQLGVKPLQAGETATDLSGLNVAKAATGLAQGAEGFVKNVTGPQPRLFTGEETTTTTGKVSNKSTIGGAQIAVDDFVDQEYALPVEGWVQEQDIPIEHEEFVDQEYALPAEDAYDGRWEGEDFIPSEKGMEQINKEQRELRTQIEELVPRTKAYKELDKQIKELMQLEKNYYKDRARKRIKERADANRKKA